MNTFLFLGDSITDCDHSFDPDNLGNGYVRMISHYFSQTSKNICIHNMGMDGHTVSGVKRTWNLFCQNLKPSIITILVGINDIAVMKNTGKDFHTFLEEYLSTYDSLIQEIRKHNDCPIILMEPFIFPWPAMFSSWESDVKEVSIAIQDLASKHNLTFLPLWEDLLAKATELGYNALTPDGVHLTSLGHQIITDSLIKTIETLY